MAKRMTLAIAIVFALVALLPAWGQTATGSAVTTTLSNIKFGVDPTDGTKTWTTTLRLVNRDATMHNENVSYLDASGNQLFAMTSDLYGASGPSNGCLLYISPLSERRRILAGLTPATLAVSAQITIEALQLSDGLPDVVASATVQETDANGYVVQSYEVVDPTTVAKNPGQGFAIGADLGIPGVDTAFVFSGPSCGGKEIAALAPHMMLERFSRERVSVGGCSAGSAANVTVSVYDGYNIVTANHVPMASVKFQLAPGDVVSETVSQLFSGNAALIAAFANPPTMGNGQPDPMLQQLVTVTSDQPISLEVSRLKVNPDGSLITTGAYAFPLAQQ